MFLLQAEFPKFFKAFIFKNKLFVNYIRKEMVFLKYLKI